MSEFDIPVLDFSRFREGDAAARAAFAGELGRACRDTGFFLLMTTGIPDAQRTAMFTVARRFFARPQAEKDAVAIAKSAHNRGYVAQKVEALDPASGVADAKEAFNVGLDLAPDHPEVLAGKPFRGVNLWPEDDPAFKAECLGWYHACLALGAELHQAFALDLGLPEDWFVDKFQAPLATLRLLRYPAGGEGIGAGAHSDYASVTLLATDGVAGLQVQPRALRGTDEWLDVPSVPGAFVVNIGDCLERWTNDVYVSTPHRVLAPKAERFSIAFFLDPDPDAEVIALPTCTGPDNPPRHAPTTGAKHLAERLDATYKHRS
ncbi:2-oxoglutarate and iron-dependent oxygenase domain-containing protein [Albimonas sp. CAU 1670]|uniref:isopenicillin N synthase family dioxygenase n=1 Tax=Albimonas sp. CAU 1670 TaxID=3032599 RepID=UPI0023DCE1C0|nr:2-oxoglutarate and iron-dependent oxygenase domain-containing protein [Albimonas sp. CAU 1670]MDF2234444.1 2-oxoglutarate and iron-dependent oxygenase domain-containing protein [Albimonas sp. CAU 1670]